VNDGEDEHKDDVVGVFVVNLETFPQVDLQKKEEA